MAPHDKQMKLSAFFLERNLVNWSDLTKHNRRVKVKVTHSPEVLTQKKMPVTTDNIATAADVKRWPHLSKIHIPSIKANVDMLIGANAPRLLEPWEIVNSCGDGPYAIRTVLGCV